MIKQLVAVFGLATTPPFKDRWLTVEFKGNSFYNHNDAEAPIVVGGGNISWPNGWTSEQAAQWRREHNIPGHEWYPETQEEKP